MKSFLAVTGAVLLTVGLTGCPGGASVYTDYDHSADFSRFHTFSFGRVMTDNPINEDRIRSDVSQDLAAKGLRLVDSGADLVVTAVGSTKNKQEYTTFYNGPAFGYYYGGFGSPGYDTTTVQNYKVGTLVIDVYASDTRRLLWRSVGKRGISDSSDAKRDHLKSAVDKMMSAYPKA